MNPIPQVAFSTCGSRDAFKVLPDALDRVHAELQSWSAFPALVDWIAWGMAVSSERPNFSAGLHEALYRQLDLGPLLLDPHDYLGAL